MDQGFVDLRQNHRETGLGQSFWPSFTDIMTVVVMIFLLTSLMLIVRNWELISELRASLEAEVRAKAASTAAMENSRGLESRLNQAQQDLIAAQLSNQQLTQQNAVQREQLTALSQQQQALAGEREQLAATLESSRREVAQLQDQLARNQEYRSQLERELELRGGRLEAAAAALAQMQQQQQTNLAELGALRRERAAVGTRLAALQADYSSLDAKYQKLLRPARSAEGKQVVEVRYWRSDGNPQIQLREPGESDFLNLSATTMHQRLTALKARYGKDLYVKIIIPTESGLSYTEAWDFTRALLDSYDYYSQE